MSAYHYKHLFIQAWQRGICCVHYMVIVSRSDIWYSPPQPPSCAMLWSDTHLLTLTRDQILTSSPSLMLCCDQILTSSLSLMLCCDQILISSPSLMLCCDQIPPHPPSWSDTHLLTLPNDRYYQTLRLWLDEPRLHEPALYIPGLPQSYDPSRLESLIHADRVSLQCVTPWQASTAELFLATVASVSVIAAGAKAAMGWFIGGLHTSPWCPLFTCCIGFVVTSNITTA